MLPEGQSVELSLLVELVELSAGAEWVDGAVSVKLASGADLVGAVTVVGLVTIRSQFMPQMSQSCWSVQLLPE